MATQNFQDLYQNYMNQFNSGNYQAVYDAAHSGDSTQQQVAKKAINDGTTQAIGKSVQSQFQGLDPATISQLTNQAIASFENSGQYSYNDLGKFLQNYNANPAFVSAQTGQALAQIQQNKQLQNQATLTAPGGQLYNTYFGNGSPTQQGGIVGAQEQNWVTGMQPQQQQAQQQLLDQLASRGLSTSGALTSGANNLNQNYQNAMNNAFSQIQAGGMQNLQNQGANVSGATTQNANNNLQAVTNSLLQQQQQQQAQQAQQQSQKANGWSWLAPVATALGTMIGGPAGGAIGAGVGSLFGGGNSNPNNQSAPNPYINGNPNNQSAPNPYINGNPNNQYY
jgi:hypothetical protein